MTIKKKVVIIGATSGIAEACARLWVDRGVREIVLVGRNKQKLEAIAGDLIVRAPEVSICLIESELTNPKKIEAIVKSCGEPQIVLIAFGMLPNQEVVQNDVLALANCLDTNALAPVLWAEVFARSVNFSFCRIALIGSVAGDRGRKSNYVYGAAKSLLERYIEGMQHRFAGTLVLPIIIKPGPTQTPMTSQIDNLQLAPVETVAEIIVDGIEKGKPVIYAPQKWSLIMKLIRLIPRAIFYRLNI